MNQKPGCRRKRSNEKKGGPFQDLVRDVVKAFSPGASVRVGEWVNGPDGRRELDVAIRGTLENHQPVFVLIECKDYTYSNKISPVGIGDIDAFESKRRDLNADFAFVASNSGFTAPALKKAARTRIAAIAVLKQGDRRAKAKILHSAILRKITFDAPVNFDYSFDGPKPESAAMGETETNIACIDGESIDQWLLAQAVDFQMGHPWETRSIRLHFRFVRPVTASYREHKWQLLGIGIDFKWRTEWLRQVIEIDAATGIYNYLVAAVFLARGRNKIALGGINFETATPCDPPTEEDYTLRRRHPGELVWGICKVCNQVDFPRNTKIANLVVAEGMAAVRIDF